MPTTTPPALTIPQTADLLARWLNVSAFHDYAPNGLQIAPTPADRPLAKLALAVTASQSVVEAANGWGADALLVHHGYFWQNEARALVGMAHARVHTFMRSGMALLAYHLPLDAHPEWGNNAQLGKRWGLSVAGHFGKQDLGCWGTRREAPQSLAQWGLMLAQDLGRTPLVIGDAAAPIHTVGWCSGGAQSYFADAIDAGVNLFITGEASEYCYHLARESGVAFIAAGHHATERFGVQALGAALAAQHEITIKFFDEANPI